MGEPADSVDTDLRSPLQPFDYLGYFFHIAIILITKLESLLLYVNLEARNFQRAFESLLVLENYAGLATLGYEVVNDQLQAVLARRQSRDVK